jgi:NTE family protein
MSVAIALGGCAAAPAVIDGTAPRFVPPLPSSRAGVALVLSAGAARGYAHVGVIKALEANGLRPDLVVGASAGAVVGALYASGLTPAELEAAVARMRPSTFTDLSLPGFGIFPGSLGLFRGDELHSFIDREVRRSRIEEFPIRFAAVATDLGSGEPVIFNAGDVGRAVAASSAVPGLIAPARIGGKLYADGQISSPAPVEVARKLGARKVILVDVVYPPEDAVLTSSMRVVFQAFTIAAHRLKQHEVAMADVLVVPELGRTSGQWGFGERGRLIAEGERATLNALPRLRPLFAPPTRVDGQEASRPDHGWSGTRRFSSQP